ncbi:gephyrin-like molybdotransferase Glp [Ammoniphilus sp. CFH 90114]|uniref:molybdopterin molybdotransferase MoeA n=1 Tax=Ammoniphilus sp. CFH 90114 TaxID=2493665 RepID=UPI00100E559E|nr:gephyrin-like molybdotransferase Glp [Ammoniphilus sp. CFH 90114]RXT05791.1 molybdopterin molybdenumtransferase MoeA [Ammoniphilus sp. CFH 90114]
MVERRIPVAIGEAILKVMKEAKTGEHESILIENCDGRFLGLDLVAEQPIPSFDRSGFDGFAVRAEDLHEAGLDHPVDLEVIEEIGAGSVPSRTVGPGQAVRIMTGAQMPAGANAVIMLELTETVTSDGIKKVRIKRSVRSGDHVIFTGQDAKAGTVLVQKGAMINPGIKALLATLGNRHVLVAKKPVIGLFVTGNELLDVDEPLVPGKIRNSNSYMIASQIIRSGGEPKYLGLLPDHFDTCYEKMKKALEDVDLLITTGGVSVGDYDYMPAIYEKLGAQVLFNKISMRPGSVTTVATWNGKLLFGLSGNPSACYVGYELLVRPVVRKQLFSPNPYLKKIQAILDTDFPKANPFTRLVRSKISYRGGRVYVSPSGLDKSNVVTSLAQSDSLMILPGGTRGYEAGREVEVVLLEDQEGSPDVWE